MNHPQSIGICSVPTRTLLFVLSSGQGKTLAEKNPTNDPCACLSGYLLAVYRRNRAAASKGSMFGSSNYFFLMVFVQVNKIIAVAGHSDEQVTVFMGGCLGFAEGFGVNDIELDMMAIQFEISPNEVTEVIDACLTFENTR